MMVMTATIVREMFDSFISGMRIVDIACMLNEKGYDSPGDYYRRNHPGTTKYKKKSDVSRWSINNVTRILHQEMYYGAVVGHKREIIIVGGTCTRAVPREEQIIVEDMHDGIYKSGLVYGIRYCYFGCYNARYNNGCCKRYLREEDINAVVWNAIQTLAAFTEQASAKAKRLEVLDYSKNEMLVAEMAKKQKQVEKCSIDKFSNVEAFMSGGISKEVYQKKRTELDEMAVSLTQEIQDMEEQLHRLELGTNSELDDAVENLSAISGEKELTRELVGELIKEIVVTVPERIEIRWNFSDEIMKFITEE